MQLQYRALKFLIINQGMVKTFNNKSVSSVEISVSSEKNFFMTQEKNISYPTSSYVII